MLQLDIPGYKDLSIKNIVFDLNGTLATDGVISEENRFLLQKLSKQFEIYILTADTFGTFAELVEGLPVIGRIASKDVAGREKQALVEELGPEHTIAVGNGNNDALMLSTASIGIAVIGEEGASYKAISSSDLIVNSTRQALELLLQPKRLIAGLRG